MRRHILAIAAVCLGTWALFSEASAQGYSPYVFGGTLGWPYNFYQDEHIPYFALHPPVYYSRPVPRTYGWSPWAYPPGVLTPEVAIEPEIIENPHVEESVAPQKGVKRAKSSVDRNVHYRRPKLIDNPYVDFKVAAE